MTRTVTGPVQTILNGQHVWMAQFIKLDFVSGPACLTNLPYNKDWNGETFLACSGLVISELRETAVPEVVGCQLAITGTFDAFIALALSESATSRGRPLTVWNVFFDADQQMVADPVEEFGGFIDVMQISESQGLTQIIVKGENRYAAFARPKIRRHTLADHQIDYPGDMFYEFVAEMADKTIVWPSREWFKQRGQQ